MQKVRCHFNYKLQLIVSIKFQYLFQFLKFYFTFPSRYLYAINHQKLFRLRGWSPDIQINHDLNYFTYGGEE